MSESKYNPDVLSCLANLSNDEVFTPPNVVNNMLDMLPQELFESKATTFLDIGTKSGVFLREIAKRLIKGLESEIPDLQKRVDHILHKQLFGIATTELTSLVSRRTLYCSKYPNCRYSASLFDTVEGNIRFRAKKHDFVNGRCKWCGASAAQFDRDDGLESHAYEFIHTDKPQEIFNMKFDVIVGNPPYQMNDGGNKNSAKPIYQHFVQQSVKLGPRYISMIIPARWYAGGKGLEEFRSQMLSDRHITHLIDYSNAKDCFPGVSLGGGVCYFLWNRDKKQECNYTNIHDGITSTLVRKLDEFPVFVRYNEALSIIHKVMLKSQSFICDIMSGRNPFGFESFQRGDLEKTKEKQCVLYYSGGVGYVAMDEISKGKNLILKYKVMISRATSEHAGEPDSSGKYNVLSVIKVLQPYEVCSDSYLVGYYSDDKKQVANFEKYARTKFFRFLVLQSVTSISLSKEKFCFVPLLDFDKEWTDKSLYEKYELSKEEVRFIESMIKEKEK